MLDFISAAALRLLCSDLLLSSASSRRQCSRSGRQRSSTASSRRPCFPAETQPQHTTTKTRPQHTATRQPQRLIHSTLSRHTLEVTRTETDRPESPQPKKPKQKNCLGKQLQSSKSSKSNAGLPMQTGARAEVLVLVQSRDREEVAQVKLQLRRVDQNR